MSRLQMKERLIEAIGKSAIVELTYKDLHYVAEVYMIWKNKRNKHYLHAYKLSGGWIRNPGPHFASFIIRYITEVKIIGKYKAPLEGYNPKSKMFDEIVCQWKYKPFKEKL